MELKPRGFLFGAFFAANLFAISACRSSNQSVRSLEVPHSEWHWGEYLQRLSDSEVITVIRSGPQTGIVQYGRGPSQKLKVLDSQAHEARDLFYTDGTLAYRVGSEIFAVKPGEPRRSLFQKVDRLQGYCQTSDHEGVFALQVSDRFVSLVHGEKTIQWEGAVRDLMCFDRMIYVLAQEEMAFVAKVFDENLALQRRYVLEEPSRISYAQFFGSKAEWSAIALHFQSGILKEYPLEDRPKPVVIDESGYAGQDISVFGDSVAYLDAWKLVPVLARKLEGSWKVQRLPTAGATGFYPQILSQTDSTYVLAFHNFRTRHPNGQTTFEDLVFLEFDWKP